MTGLFTTVAMLCAMAAGASAPPASERTYVGHHVVLGSVPLPVLGDVETRTDTHVLVTLTQGTDVMRWQQRTCRVAMKPVAGVKSSLPEATVAKLPAQDIRLDRGADGVWRGAWDTHWSAADLDGDGHPGVSIRVDVPLCAGYVYVSTRTHTQATVSLVGDTYLGELRVTMHQRVLGASNFCLRMGPREQRQVFEGVLTLVPAPDVATCDIAAAGVWPVAM